MSNNTYVLDTSILLAEGTRIFSSFKDASLAVPYAVIVALEALRYDKLHGPVARELLVALDAYSRQDDHDLGNGVTITVWGPEDVRDEFSDIADPHHAIMVSETMSFPEPRAYLLSRDVALNHMAQYHGALTATHHYEPPNKKFIETVQTFYIKDSEFNTLADSGEVRLDVEVPLNTGVVLKAGNRSLLAISKQGYTFVKIPPMEFYKFKARSKEQHIAMKQLSDESIRAVSIGGVAGSGKTAMALAAAVAGVKERKYEQILVFRSMHAVGGEDLGFLPGDEQEKLDPWTAAVYDALSGVLSKSEVSQWKSKGIIKVLPITHVRGRTFSNSYIIMDETQNLDKDTIKTLLTRLGQSSKIVLTHDVSQRDNHRIKRWEGIHEVVYKMHGTKLFAHTTMVKSERSDLAQLAAELLDD